MLASFVFIVASAMFLCIAIAGDFSITVFIDNLDYSIGLFILYGISAISAIISTFYK